MADLENRLVALERGTTPESSEIRIIGPIIGLSVGFGFAGLELARDNFPRYLVRLADLGLGWIFAGLDSLHNGVVGDYVA